jgi:hypothetical protein
MRSTTSVVLGAVVSVLSACGSAGGDCEGTASCEAWPTAPDAGRAQSATPVAQADVGAPSRDARPDAYASGEMPAVEAADAAASAPTCQSRFANPVTGVFVSPAGIDGPGCGSRAVPCATIAWALSRARAALVPNVYVAPGTYTASVALPAGMAIEGGWLADSWAPDCGAAAPAAVLEAAATGATITAKDIGGSARLAYLCVRSRPHGALSAGESAYGVLASGETTHLELEHVDIRASSAADGVAGGSPHTAGLHSGTCPTPGSGRDSTQIGAVGTSSVGSFSPMGYVPGDGAAGSPGAVGDNGLAGQAGGCVLGTLNGCIWVGYGPDRSCSPTGRTPEAVCSNAGLPGCGGLPGAGGYGGRGGGASIALYVWKADVTLRAGSIVAGDGGSGGPGGLGGRGGLGSDGQPGPTTYVSGGGCAEATTAESCAGINRAVAVEGGAPGTPGGKGAPGGQGGGGSGGPSFAIFHAGSPALRVDGTELIAGSPGLGAGDAPGGLSAPIQDSM